jgi:hypothetical protein
MMRFRFHLGTLVILVLLLGVDFAALRESVLGRGSSGIFEPRFVRGFLGQHETEFSRNRERLAWGAGGGDEQPLLDGTMPAKLPPGWPPHATPSSNISSLALAARAQSCHRGI